MTKKLLLLIPIAGAIGMGLLSNSNATLENFHKDGVEKLTFSSNPNLGLTGAPGEGNCTQCHGGNAQSAQGNVSLVAPTEYAINQTYTIEIGATGGSSNGFEMTILDANNNQAGTFTAGSGTSVASQSGKEYIRQNSVSGFWTFNWTAPATDMGQLTAYYSFNKSNGNFSTSGDVVYLGQHVIGSSITNDLSDYEKQDAKVNIFFNDNSEQLVLKYALNSKARVQVNISDLSGKLVQSKHIGEKSFGLHTDKIDLDQVSKGGVYIVSLFINNNVYNRKVYLK
jgi:hypothetical protein